MKNPQVSPSAKRQIDKSVSRLLADLRGLEPPLDLAKVRSKLDLDLHFYSGKDPSHFRQIVHSIKVAGKEHFPGKKQLSWIIEKLGLKGLLFWDANQIHIDSDLHEIKYRWAESHEIGHKLCDWHKYYLLGDTQAELSHACHVEIEAEANYASGQLVFMQKRFLAELMGSPLSIGSLKSLSTTFGNSKATTLWRMVEEYEGDRAVVGIVSGHPHHPALDFNPLEPCRYVIQSNAFRAKFGDTSEVQLFSVLKEFASFRKGGTLGTKEIELIDDNGDSHEFLFDSFCFNVKDKSSHSAPMCYQVLTLGVEQQRVTKCISSAKAVVS
jgi:hypothetical protein